MEAGLDDDLLLAVVRKFEEAEEAGNDARLVSERCRDYYDGNQLSEAQKAEYAKRKQPQLVNNRIRRKVDWLRGMEMQSRTDPRAFPRTPKHQQGAEAATDAIRYVCDKTDFDRQRSYVWENMLIEGFGGVEVIHEGQEVLINYYPSDRLFFDPYSRKADFSDARYLGAVVWADREALAQDYPEAKDAIDASIAISSGMIGAFEDTPAWKRWTDKSRQRTRLVLMHYLDGGVWKWAKFVKGGIIESGDSPYVDEKGKSACQMVMQSAYVGREGERYGSVVDMLDPQDELNMRRSKLLHMLNSRQTVTLKGAVSVSAMKAAMASADGNIEVDPDVASAAAERGLKPFEVLPQGDQIMGQFNLLQEVKQELDLLGANSGLAGKDPAAAGASGRAIMAKQQGGLIEIAPLTDNLSDFTRRVYREVWSRIRQFWREEKWIRVTDDERNVRFVGLNKQVTLGDKLGQMAPEMAAAYAQQMGLMPNDPRLGQVVGMENPVEEMDVDILLEEVPDVVTLEAETFQAVANIAQSMPGSVPPDVLIELTPGLKRDVKDKLLKKIEEQQQAQSQQGQQQAQFAQNEAGAKMDNLAADTQKKQADTQKTLSLASKTQVEAQRLALGY